MITHVIIFAGAFVLGCLCGVVTTALCAVNKMEDQNSEIWESDCLNT